LCHPVISLSNINGLSCALERVCTTPLYHRSGNGSLCLNALAVETNGAPLDHHLDMTVELREDARLARIFRQDQ
jgi:hypothetical protein